MSAYTGPGLYRIFPVNAPSKAIGLRGGVDGNRLVIWGTDTNAEHFKFEIVAAGGPNAKPEIGDREYHILMAGKGQYATKGSGSDQNLTATYQSPLNAEVRWKLTPTGVNGAYYINTTDGQYGWNVRGGDTADDTAIIWYKNTNASNMQFFLVPVN